MKKLKELENNGYTESFNKEKIKYERLTEEGRKKAREIAPIGVTVRSRSKADKKRIESNSRVSIMLSANSFSYIPSDKPLFEEYFKKTKSLADSKENISEKFIGKTNIEKVSIDKTNNRNFVRENKRVLSSGKSSFVPSELSRLKLVDNAERENLKDRQEIMHEKEETEKNTEKTDKIVYKQMSDNDKRNLLHAGVYYTSKEIKAAYEKIRGGRELLNQSRFNGVMFCNGKIKIIYALNNRLIKANKINEKRAVEEMMKFFGSSPLISASCRIEGKPESVVIGKGYRVARKIIYGRWNGKIEPERRKGFSERYENNQFTAKVFESIYSRMTFVNLSNKGKKEFYFAVQTDKQDIEELRDRYFQDKGIFCKAKLKYLKYNEGEDKEKRNYIYMPIVEIMELRYYKSTGKRYYVTGPKRACDLVYRVLGPNIIEYRDLDGNVIENRYKYDYNGNIIEGSRFGIDYSQINKDE